MAEIKFCGLTRAEDALIAGRLGAGYIGVIFAGGPRQLTPGRAAMVLDGCETAARRVGVFGEHTASDIARIADEAGLDVVQLHGDPTAADVTAARAETGAELWAVVRVTNSLPSGIDELFDVADAVLIDSRVSGVLGGSGVAAEWEALRPQLERRRATRRVVLAGGLGPENVARALAALAPDVVDVSSGVESAPGIKDHARMRAFAAAVAGAGRGRE